MLPWYIYHKPHNITSRMTKLRCPHAMAMPVPMALSRPQLFDLTLVLPATCLNDWHTKTPRQCLDRMEHFRLNYQTTPPKRLPTTCLKSRFAFSMFELSATSKVYKHLGNRPSRSNIDKNIWTFDGSWRPWVPIPRLGPYNGPQTSKEFCDLTPSKTGTQCRSWAQKSKWRFCAKRGYPKDAKITRPCAT